MLGPLLTRAAFTQAGVKLPLTVDIENGCALDAGGNELFVVDVHRDRPDADVTRILTTIVDMVNAGTGVA